MRRTCRSGESIAVSSLAIATMLAASGQGAQAQSFQGTGSVVGGSATINTSPGSAGVGASTSVTVNSSTAVINWVPSDTATGGGPIAFQPNGTTATFTNNVDLIADFAVLNRILPTDPSRPVQFDGTVIAQLQSAAGAPTRGGTVFFYSPGGILIGSNAVFDVGNLGLTASDLPYDPQTGAFSSGGLFQFQQAAAGASVEIAQGAQLHVGAAGPDNSSYLAIVAPRIVQDGAIDVNGSAALVAADAATIQFSPSGLFSIQVDQGTSATGTVLSNSGSITGAAGSSATFIHRIYMVAVPRNTAITMAIASGSTLGFDVAGAADVVGNTVVLSAGSDVFDGNALPYHATGGGTGEVALAIGAITATSAVVGTATGLASVTVQAGETSSFASDVALAGTYRPGSGAAGGNGTLVSVTGSGAALAVNGNFDVNVLDSGQVDLTSVSDVSAATVAVDGGALNVAGRLLVHADRYGLTDGGSATGGTAVLSALNGAQVTVGGVIDLGAFGTGASPDAALTGGTGTGGTARLTYGAGAQVSAGSIAVFADGRGGTESSGYGGAAGFGGTATVEGVAGGGTLTVAGGAQIGAGGFGTNGYGCVTCIVDGGIGTGGTAQLRLAGSAQHTVTMGGDLAISATAQGGDSQGRNAGSGGAGTAQLVASGGAHALGIGGTTTVSAEGLGGRSVSTAPSGTGMGGIARIVTSGAAFTLHGVVVDASGSGGYNGDGGIGGIGNGGTAQVRVGTGGGSIAADTVVVRARGVGGYNGGSFADGGPGQGGTASVDAMAGQVALSGLSVIADGYGGNGTTIAGTGHGGLAAIRAQGGAISVSGDVSASSDAIGGQGGRGADATGGHVELSVDGGSLAFGSGDGAVYASANGSGGAGTLAVGNGTGGTVAITAANGTADFAAGLYVIAHGVGGDSLSSGVADAVAGGAGQGGAITIDAASSLAGASQISASTMRLSVTGIGGKGEGGLGLVSPGGSVGGSVAGTGGVGGNGVGGIVTVNAGVTNGTLLVGALTLDVDGNGGAGGDGGFNSGSLGSTGGNGGAGGAGAGGTVLFDTNGALAGVASSGRLQLGGLTLSANGIGGVAGAGGSGVQLGSAGEGGNGIGGFVTVRADRGGSLVQFDGNSQILADGYGAQGVGCTGCLQDGGLGTGGAILLIGDGTTSGNQIKLGTVFADASGVGGGSLTTAGGRGVGGSTRIIANAGLTVTAGQMTLRGIGFGGTAQANFVGGAADGGLVALNMHTGSTLNVTGALFLDAAGVGGGSQQSGGVGGAAKAGVASLQSLGGQVTLADTLTIGAAAFGGTGDQTGGAGVGGAATGGVALLGAGDDTQLGNGGSIAVAGATTVYTSAYGGWGSTGGAGAAGTAAILAHDGSLTLGVAQVDATGTGGNGLFGGKGGRGTGGAANLVTFNALEGAADIAIASASLSAIGQGGSGGDAPANGNAGGAGGDGIGGSILAAGSAGNGRITLGDTNAVVEGRGGAGGTGGANDGGLGGAGGKGGTGAGGALQIGTISGLDTGALNTGAASFGAVYAYATGVGGSGGTGGTGATGTGAGGDGGDALGGGAVLLVRGSPVTLTGDGYFSASAFGGNGGTGSVQGAGGNATIVFSGEGQPLVGAILEATSRYQVDAQRGSLDAQGLSFSTNALGGAGATNGIAVVQGTPIGFDMVNADLVAQSLSFSAQGPVATDALSSAITLQNSSAQIAQGFDFVTSGDLVVSLDTASLVAGQAQISARNWLESGRVVTAPGTIHANGPFMIASAGDVVGDVALSSTLDLAISVPGSIRLAGLSAGGGVSALTGGAINLGTVSASGGVDLSAGGALLVAGPVAAVDRAILNATGTLTVGDVMVAGSVPSSLRELAVLASGAITLGDIDAGATRLFGLQGITAGVVTAGDFAVLAGGDITLGGIVASGRVLLADVDMADGGSASGSPYDFDALFAATPVRATGAIMLGGPVQAGSLVATTSQTLTTQGLTTTGAMTLDAVGTISVGAITTGADFVLTGGAGAQTGAVDAGTDVTIAVAGDFATTSGAVAGGGVLPQAISAGGGVDVSSTAGALTLGDVTAGETAIYLSAPGAISTGRLAAFGGVSVTSGNDALVLGNITAGEDLTLQTAAMATTGTLFGSFVTVVADGGFSAIGSATRGGALAPASVDGTFKVSITSRDGALLMGDVTSAEGAIDLTAGTSLGAGALSAGGNLSAVAQLGDLTLGTVDATVGSIDLTTGGALQALDVNAYGGVAAQAVTTMALGAVTAATGNIALDAGTTLQAADLSSLQGTVTLNAGGGASLGHVDGFGGVLGTIGGDASFAGIGSADQGIDLTSGGTITVTQGVVAATDITLVATGSLALGYAAGGNLSATATGDVTIGQVDATGSIVVGSGGLVSVGARWSAPSISLSSRSIAIATGLASGGPVGLDAGVSGTILLQSRSQQGVVLGDGTTPSEYTISAAEWATIRSGSLTVRGLDTTGAIDMRIGNLDVTGPMAGSTIDDPNGVVRFETVNADGGISGAIRISGNLSTRGFLATNALEFATGRFEVDAATGSLGLYGASGQLAGILRISADGIHVASAAILDRLATDPFYSGLEVELDQPAAVQRPAGVLAAGSFDFTVGRTFYVQNTGTKAVPAGFVTAADGLRIVPAGTGQVRMIVNGAFLRSGALLSGADTFDAFKTTHTQTVFLADDSRLEGCLISAASCGAVNVPVEVTGPTLGTQIEILGQGGLGDTPGFGNGPDGGGGGDGGGSDPQEQGEADKATAGPPIMPPAPLIDMRPLNPPGRIEEPVAGSGNPALMGSPVDEASAEGAQ